MNGGLEPAWVISQRPYGNSGRLVEFFAANTGRFSAVAKGVHRKAHGGQQAQLLQLFYPLLVAVSGRHELRTLTRVEPAGVALRPAGNAAVCGMYINELLIRLLPRFDPHPTLFARYGETLTSLSAGAVDGPLRRFEVQLLDELGYTIPWHLDANEQSIEPALGYGYVPGVGFVPGQPGQYRGADLLAIASWLQAEQAEVTKVPMGAFRQLTRQALQHLLGDRPLQTRELAKELDWGARS